MMRRIGLVLALFVMGGIAVQADELTGGLSGVSVISDGSGAHRVLFRASEVAGLTDVAVRRAVLTVPLGGSSEREMLHLEVCPVTAAWTPGAASWNSGWSRAGGDYDDELAARADVDLTVAGGAASFDVTPIVKELIESGAAFDGFILSVQSRDGIGLNSTDLARLQSLAGASLTVEYRNVPHRSARVARALARRGEAVAPEVR